MSHFAHQNPERTIVLRLSETTNQTCECERDCSMRRRNDPLRRGGASTQRGRFCTDRDERG